MGSDDRRVDRPHPRRHETSPRGGAAMVYDSTRQVFVIFGGRSTRLQLRRLLGMGSGDWRVHRPERPGAKRPQSAQHGVREIHGQSAALRGWTG